MIRNSPVELAACPDLAQRITLMALLRSALRTRELPLAMTLAFGAAAVVAIALSAVVAAVAHAAGVSHDFAALTIPVFTPFIIIGLLGGAVAWAIVGQRSAAPGRLMRWLAPTVVLLSFVPDILVGAQHGLPGTSWGGIFALMTMHLIVAAAGITSYRFFLPLPSTRTP